MTQAVVGDQCEKGGDQQGGVRWGQQYAVAIRAARITH